MKGYTCIRPARSKRRRLRRIKRAVLRVATVLLAVAGLMAARSSMAGSDAALSSPVASANISGSHLYFTYPSAAGGNPIVTTSESI